MPATSPFITRILLVSLAGLLTFQPAFAKQQPGDTIALPQRIRQFIPKGYSVLDTAMGDLNFDKVKDIVLVLKNPAEDTALDMEKYKRPLLLLLGRSNKTFTLAARNDHVVYCRQCGGALGEPFTGITIKNGSFTVNHFGGSNERWSNEIVFNYSKAERTWQLFQTIDKSWTVFNLNKIESVIKTKKDFGIVRFEDFDADRY